jgi:phage terminase large subunit
VRERAIGGGVLKTVVWMINLRVYAKSGSLRELVGVFMTNLWLDEKSAVSEYEICACEMRNRRRDDKSAICEKSALVGEKSWSG